MYAAPPRLRNRTPAISRTVARGSTLPSSRCDDLFWFGRELERLETLVRLLHAAVIPIEDWAQGERPRLPGALPPLAAAHALTLTFAS